MEKQPIIGLVIGLVVIGGGMWYFSSANPSATKDALSNTGDQSATTASAVSALDGAEHTGTLADLVGITSSVECTIKSSTSVSQTEGVVRVAGGKMRGDFTSTVQGTKVAVHSSIITDAKDLYSWSDAAPQGVKAPMVTTSADGTKKMTGGLEGTASVSYACKPWTADESVFIVPTTVKFISAPGA